MKTPLSQLEQFKRGWFFSYKFNSPAVTWAALIFSYNVAGSPGEGLLSGSICLSRSISYLL